MRTGVIYKITNLVNGKIYIGRCIRDLEYYLGGGIIIKNAVEKYGRENFSREVLEYVSEDTLNEREKHWIKIYDSQNPLIGYNISEGGEDGSSLFGYIESIRGKNFDEIHGPEKSAEIREKFALNMRNRWKDEEYRNMMSSAISIGKTGTKLSNEHRKKISAGMLGREVSEETKLKLRASNIGKKQKHAVMVRVTNKETGEVTLFNNTTHAARVLGISFYCIKHNVHTMYNFERIYETESN